LPDLPSLPGLAGLAPDKPWEVWSEGLVQGNEIWGLWVRLRGGFLIPKEPIGMHLEILRMRILVALFRSLLRDECPEDKPSKPAKP
jgi:hypothetical protein